MKNTSYSFWEDNYGDYTPNAPLKGNQTADVVVIGGGFTGLTVAREVRNDNPGARVVVLEARYVGFGASGRNGGFNASQFGFEPGLVKLMWGKERAGEAQNYMKKAVEYVRNLSEDHELDNDYEHKGGLRIAYTPPQVARLKKTFELLNEFSPSSCEWLNAPEVQARVNSPRPQAAFFEPDVGVLDPTKHVRALKRLAEAAGAEIYENSPVTTFKLRHGGVEVLHREGRIKAERIVIALNAWTHLFRGPSKLKSRQRPVWTSQVVTEPLSAAVWDKIGWAARESIVDNRKLMHYFRRTACGRIVMGGGNIALPGSRALDRMDTPKLYAALEAQIKWLFPVLQDVKITHQWGGAVSINTNGTPEVSFIGDERVIHASGCIGHGVSLTQLNGRMIADIIAEQKTERTDFWILNRKSIPFPGDPIGHLFGHGFRGTMQLWDNLNERSLRDTPQ